MNRTIKPEQNITDEIKVIGNYYKALKKAGIHSALGNHDALWIQHEKFSVVRFPEFDTSQPSDPELKRIFKELKCLLINYTFISDSSSKNKSWLYNCTDRDYNIDKLTSSSVRRNIRYAQRHLEHGFVDWDYILDKGFTAFRDTRSKVGLSDGNLKTFNSRFQKFSLNPYHKAAAAWSGDKLAAFMSLIDMDGYVIIQGTFSTNEHKAFKPNNLLIDFLLNHYMHIKKYNLVCYGVSSIQENTSTEGLHAYKIQVGFDAIPVQRVFLLHPFLKPFEALLRGIMKLLLKIYPKNRLIRKAEGFLKLLSDTN